MIGGCLFTGWVPSQHLRPGDRLTTLGGTSLVHSVTYTSARATVYNLTVSGVSNYLIGPDGVWVHNCEKVRAIRNLALAGKYHPVTNVPFDSSGYPVFDDWSIFKRKRPGGHQGRSSDRKWTETQFDPISDDYIVHRHQDGITLMVVDSFMHMQTGHNGPKPGH